ncbi:MAG: hypothetical protein LUE27_04410 [Clostridia bacterium]|nr:hypothetical protein [Clostridia bacterium]
MERRFIVRPVLKGVDENTIEIEYKPKKFLPKMSIRLHLEGCRQDVICVSYECSMPMAMIIAGTVAHLEDKIPAGIEIKSTEKRINLYVEQIEALQKILAYVSLKGISFMDDHVQLSLSLK